MGAKPIAATPAVNPKNERLSISVSPGKNLKFIRKNKHYLDFCIDSKN